MDINRNNYESFFLLYLDRELGQTEKQEVEKFLGENTDLQKEFVILQQTIFSPAEIEFEQKELLFREEEKRRVIPLYRMRFAAAVAALILGGWLMDTRLVINHSGGIALIHQPAELQNKANKPAERNANPGKEENKIPNRVNSNPEDQLNKADHKDQSTDQHNGTANKATKNSGSENLAVKNQNDLPGKIKQDPQNQPSNGDVDESLIARQKSSTALEIQSSENQNGGDLNQISAKPGDQATVPLIAAVNTKDKPANENSVLQEADFPTDNAISVIALNEKNKGITGFFKKLTKQPPADEKTRKVRVSVFQFSY
jgi:hypothetical protein